jgi:hypothetical protein
MHHAPCIKVDGSGVCSSEKTRVQVHDDNENALGDQTLWLVKKTTWPMTTKVTFLLLRLWEEAYIDGNKNVCPCHM